ncbi:hypothetical protein [Riemerella columbina]|uniref:hypothetical protein n=1 Tax=Riemerella columbina TaxID=103810 RepID=UPI00266ECEFF|nr:hypothetical protein [Riemerella columbina]WKS95349.1 hypothetical protein NYR17_01010 [Riemerella columbina]
MSYGLENFLAELESPPQDMKAFFEENKYFIRGKGYGTPELEMKYLHNIFLKIQKKHPDFQKFSWVQYNSFNDNYHYFKLLEFGVNDFLEVYPHFIFSFYPDDHDKIPSEISFYVENVSEQIKFAKKKNLKYNDEGLVKYKHFEKFRKYINKKNQHLITPSLQFLSLIKIIELNLSMYYFLYTFGNGVKVEFSTEGVRVTQLSGDEHDMDPLGVGMDFDDANNFEKFDFKI